MYGECIRVKIQKFAWTVGRSEGSEAEAGGDKGVRQIEIHESDERNNTENATNTSKSPVIQWPKESISFVAKIPSVSWPKVP